MGGGPSSIFFLHQAWKYIASEYSDLQRSSSPRSVPVADPAIVAQSSYWMLLRKKWHKAQKTQYQRKSTLVIIRGYTFTISIKIPSRETILVMLKSSMTEQYTVPRCASSSNSKGLRGGGGEWSHHFYVMSFLFECSSHYSYVASTQSPTGLVWHGMYFTITNTKDQKLGAESRYWSREAALYNLASLFSSVCLINESHNEPDPLLNYRKKISN